MGSSLPPDFSPEEVAEAAKLPEPEQDALAAVILEELASERRWDQAFTDSADLLA
jgi:hypothetical protein